MRVWQASYRGAQSSTPPNTHGQNRKEIEVEVKTEKGMPAYNLLSATSQALECRLRSVWCIGLALLRKHGKLQTADAGKPLAKENEE